MKKIIIPIILLFAAVACNKEVKPFDAGVLLDEVNVPAASGQLSVNVRTAGVWKVYTNDSWLSLDVQGGNDGGAFTVHYDANTSNVSDIRSARRGSVIIVGEQSYKSDTLAIIQQGFCSEVREGLKGSDTSLSIELEQPEIKTLKVLYCSAEGLSSSAELKAWAQGKGFDVVACGKDFLLPESSSPVALIGGLASMLEYEGLNFVTADFGSPRNDEKDIFVSLTDTTYNAQDAPANWVIGGQFYHYSMMQAGYSNTPSWYPKDDFQADRYAWTNNLCDVAWMSKRNYFSTWTDSQGQSYSADYVYVSRSVLNYVYAVEVIDAPLTGMAHKPISITLKYSAQ